MDQSIPYSLSMDAGYLLPAMPPLPHITPIPQMQESTPWKDSSSYNALSQSMQPDIVSQLQLRSRLDFGASPAGLMPQMMSTNPSTSDLTALFNDDNALTQDNLDECSNDGSIDTVSESASPNLVSAESLKQCNPYPNGLTERDQNILQSKYGTPLKDQNPRSANSDKLHKQIAVRHGAPKPAKKPRPKVHSKKSPVISLQPLEDFLSKWTGTIPFRTLLSVLAEEYPNILFEFNGNTLSDQFNCTDSRISREEYDAIIEQFASNESVIDEFLVTDMSVLPYELKLRKPINILLKFPLIAAAEKGWDDLVRMFGQKHDPNTKLPGSIREYRQVGQEMMSLAGMDALRIACVNQDVETCRELLKMKLDLTFNDDEPMPPLHIAITQKNKDLVEQLVETRIPLDQPYQGTTALYTATELQLTDIVKLLVDSGANPIGKGEDKWIPLHSASSHGNLELMKYFLDLGSDIEAKTNHGCTPLDTACKFVQPDSCELLIEVGADVNCTDTNGWTPLHVACWKGSLEICKILVENDADVNAVTEQKRTPLHVAAFNHFGYICDFLLKNSAESELLDADGCTPLQLAVWTGSMDTTHALIGGGCDLHVLTEDKETLLHSSVAAKKHYVTQYLLNLDIDKNARDKDGKTAVYIAIEKGDLKALKLLKEAGCDFEIMYDSQSLLHVAAKYGRDRAIPYLLELDFDINYKDNKGNTPLHYAAQSGKTKAIEVILENEAEYVSNREGLYPEDMAQNANHAQAAKLLRMHRH